MKSLALEEYYAILTAGGRNSGEKSHAVESKYYGRNGDPANHVEYPAEIERQKKMKNVKRKKRRK